LYSLTFCDMKFCHVVMKVFLQRADSDIMPVV